MALTRRVYGCRRDGTGGPAALVSRSAPWSPRPAREAADDIASGQVRYVVEWESGTVEVTLGPEAHGARRCASQAPGAKPTGSPRSPTPERAEP